MRATTPWRVTAQGRPDGWSCVAESFNTFDSADEPLTMELFVINFSNKKANDETISHVSSGQTEP
jgi:hypothetical protein